MTREGAIIILGNIPIDDDECYSIPQYQEAKTMAIEALEQLTSYERTINKLTKAISEQEPFDIETYCKEHFVVMVDKDVWEKAEKALEQEPCDDAISREAVIKTVDTHTNEDGTLDDDISVILEELPPVKPQEPKEGHWICIDDYHIGKFKCSVCQTEGFPNTVMYEPTWNYCPNCGAKMKVGE